MGEIKMDDMIMESKKLNQMIKSSKEYRDYVHALNSIRSNEDLHRALVDFKNIYADALKYTEGNPYDELNRMYSENDELLHNSVVSEYLRAESAFSKLVKTVIDEVSNGIVVGV